MILAACVGAAGCSKYAEAPAVVARAVKTGPSAEVPATQPAQIALFTTLAEEKAGRPTGTPSTDVVIDALSQAGLPLEQRKQFLGKLIGAHYCEGGRTTGGLGVSICEFNDAPGAIAGKAPSEKSFGKLFPNREIVVNKKTILTIVEPQKTAALMSQAETAKGIFLKL